MNAKGTVIQGNKIKGNINTINTTRPNMAGIYLNASRNLQLRCNHDTATRYGFQVIGNCGTTNNAVSGNDFYNHINGILLRHLGAPGTLGSSIGTTNYDNRNLFLGNYATHTTNGNTYSSKLYRVSQCANGTPTNDQFFTTTTLTNNESDGNYASCNYGVTTNYGASSPATCLLLGLARITDPDTVTDPLLAEFIARNAIEWAEYQDGTQWVQAQYLYNQLEQSPEVRAAYPVLDSFYTAVQDNGFEDMGNAEEWLADIADSAVNADAAAFETWYNNAIADNNAIDTATDIMLANEKLINDIYLRYSRYGIDSITSDDYNLIEELALQCPLVGGTAVYKARMLYGIYQPSISYDDLEICNNAGLYKGGKGLFDDENAMLSQQLLEMRSDKLTVYPNPTSGQVTFEYSIKNGEKAELIITDVYGKKLLQLKLANLTKTIVDLSRQPAGVYFYRYVLSGATGSSGKIILVK